MTDHTLESEFLIQYSKQASKLHKKTDNHLSIHGISFTEYMIMRNLSASALQSMRRIEIAESVGLSASGVTRLLAPMEKIGIVERQANPRDARQSLVKLSKAGQQLFEDAKVSFDECAKNTFSGLSRSQLDKLVELSAKL